MYIPLFNKSNYTLLSSLLKIGDIIDYAKKTNISAIALTDTNMYGTMEFIKKCEQENIKPIIWLHIILEDFTTVLYAKDYEGYKSLIKLSTIQNERQVTIEDITIYNKNVIAVIPYDYSDKYQSLQEIYQELYKGKSIHLTEIHELNFNFEKEILNGDLIIEIISIARGEKTINNVSLKTPIKNLTIELDKELKEAIELSIKDFKATLFIDNLELEDGSEKYKIKKIELEY